MTVTAALAGRWWIVEAAIWQREYLDPCGAAFLRIDFDWKGSDEGDQVQGTGWTDYGTMVVYTA